jgi:hypothetical protein
LFSNSCSAIGLISSAIIALIFRWARGVLG